MKIAYISANLGRSDMDIQDKHVKQDVEVDFHYFTDENYKPRDVVHPRMRSKIPKMLAWKLITGYDFYIWGDSCITLNDKDSVSLLLSYLGENDIAFFKHPEDRNSIKDELDHMEEHMAGNISFNSGFYYLNERYKNEQLSLQVKEYLSDPDFIDNHLYSGGLFIYRNTEKVREMLSSWLMHNLLYTIQDQLSLPYVLSKYPVKISKIDLNLLDCKISKRWRNCLDTSAHKWDEVYKTLPSDPTAFIYGDTNTYEIGAEFLKDCEVVEDWGTGAGGFKRFRRNAIGVDGSITPFAEIVADLRFYKSNVDGIFLRHVLEHNWQWKNILINAIQSAKKKLVLILFTPLTESLQEIKEGSALNKEINIDVPTLSLCLDDIMEVFKAFSCEISQQKYNTNTHYGEEIVFLIEKI